jgi:cytochrome P450
MRDIIHPMTTVDLFSANLRRDPYAAYGFLRASSPVLRVPPPFNGWMLFDYDAVKWALNDHDTFSSQVPAPKWFIFFDPPSHTKLRALVSRAFTPRMIANLEPRIRELSRELLDAASPDGLMDLARDYAVPLPMRLIAGMIGMADSEMPLYQRWSDAILGLSYSRSGDEEAARAQQDFVTVTAEMDAYLIEAIAQRRANPRRDLLSELLLAEVDGERLSHQEILAFFQLLVVAGQETTSNLINNAVLCLTEYPDQLKLLRTRPGLLPSAIEEVLRYRSPLQWVMRTPRRDIEIHATTIPAKSLVLPMLGSANRDPLQFAEAGRFNITRDPNPHVAFGQGIHFCCGAALSRLEARVALGDLLSRFSHFELATSEPWEPRKALHVHGPDSLPIRFERNRSAVSG